ncbi:hypothetical protein DP113_24805 [Brasilonema octagenarum UFV-E1]|uniref:Uncharacterized protein n=1 Tax=Brasilonema sennae CENA114 TaxID=415709 RepID=A0A856MK51_9CYAN|nr:hypothetical protein DP114_24905 [Brasilonema sennae CENA114]QDL17053.1 hypothetical protein DP113_24805 [Brasilonema octagenarum UFV-E1]
MQRACDLTPVLADAKTAPLLIKERGLKGWIGNTDESNARVTSPRLWLLPKPPLSLTRRGVRWRAGEVKSMNATRV